MFEDILLLPTRDLLQKLKPENLPPNSYLAGGTAIALQIGHRKSEDLDFFTQTTFLEEQWQQKLEEDLGFKVVQRDVRTLVGTVQGVKMSLLGYKYPLIRKETRIYKFPLASLEDLSGMKLSTVMGRGTRRDLIDIYFLAKKFGLRDMLAFYQEKYGNLGENELMIKKALVYFTEADEDEMPEMLTQIKWEEVKSWLTREVKKL